MADILNYIVQHWTEIVQGVTSIIGGFAIISKITPTTTDDKIVNFLLQFLHFGALNLKKDDPNPPKTPSN